MILRFAPHRLFRVLLAAAVFLIVTHLGVRLLAGLLGREQMLAFTALFHLDREMNIPTWYSSATLLASSGLLALIAVNERYRKTDYRRHWTFLSLIFLYLSVDETASIHEPVGAFIRGTFHTTGLVYHAWVIPAAAIVLVLAAFYWRWLLALPAAIRRLAALSAVVYVAGAAGMEMLAGLLVSETGQRSRFYSIATTLEETLEMLGVAIWIYALARYAAAKRYGVTLEFELEEPADKQAVPASPGVPTHSAA